MGPAPGGEGLPPLPLREAGGEEGNSLLDPFTTPMAGGELLLALLSLLLELDRVVCPAAVRGCWTLSGLSGASFGDPVIILIRFRIKIMFRHDRSRNS